MTRYSKNDPKPTIAVLKDKITKPKQQITHDSTIEQGLSKPRTINEMIRSTAQYHYPEKDAWRKRLCYSLLEWAETDDALDMVQFLILYKFSKSQLHGWLKTYPEIKEAYEQAKLWVGARRRVGHIKRYYSDGVYKDMYKYDPEWLEIDKYNQTLKGDSDQGQVINVYLPEIKKTTEVPILEEPVQAIETTRSE